MHRKIISMQARSYLKKRNNEAIENFPESFHSMIRDGYFQIETALEATEVTPAFARRVTILEYLLFAFIEHCQEPHLIDDMEAALRVDF